MVTIQAGRLVPIPCSQMLDPQTGKITALAKSGHMSEGEFVTRFGRW